MESTAKRHVYKCRWTGDFAFALGVDLDELPMRRTDNARIINLEEHPLLNSALRDGPTVCIKRTREDATQPCIETQHRKLLGKLPVAYTSKGGASRLFVMDDAVEEGEEEKKLPPVPPCVVLLPDGAGVRFSVDDRGSEAGFIKIRTDDVLVQTISSVANDKCNEELLDFLAKAMLLRRSTLAVVHGVHKKHKTVQFAEMSREAVFNRMRDAVQRGFSVDASHPSMGGGARAV
eukprot:jgi/Ulvmu1/6961/UM033_0018.1